MSPARRLSKSKYVAGQQCHRLLWWQVHEPDAPELVPDASARAVMDQGSRVGALARTYVPGGTLIDVPYDRYEAKLAATSAALAARAPAVYEASFSAGGIFVAVDILERLGEDHGLIEVKSSTKVKPEHLPDAAVQAHVLAQSGLEVRRVEVMHLNRACTFPDLSDLFTRTDVTTDVATLLPEVPTQVRQLLRMLEADLPEVPIGSHCSDPRECPFVSRCWAEVPDDHVTTLFRIGKKAWDLEAQGFGTIRSLPANLKLNGPAERQRRAVVTGGPVVEPTLRDALRAFEPPLAFLDFETINPAVPVWNGCHPYDNIPVQFSCHRLWGDGRLTHEFWLADGSNDPRPGIAAALVEACAGAGAIVAYNASFEVTCLRTLAAALGGRLAHALHDIEHRIVDLLPTVRDHVYHPAFGGSFSLKSVLPALVAGLSYEGMEIAEGGTASTELQRLILQGDILTADERSRLREALLRYCEMDTRATVELLERLRALAGS